MMGAIIGAGSGFTQGVLLNDSLRSSGNSMGSDSTPLLISTFFKPSSSSPNINFLNKQTAGGHLLNVSSGTIFAVYGFSSAGTQSMQYVGTKPVVAGVWNHALFSRAPDGSVQCYINDSIDAPDGTSFNSADSFNYSSTLDATILVSNSTASAAYQQMYIAAGQWLNLSDITNRRKFITSDGRPVAMGNNGIVPTGSAPTFYFAGSPSQIISNRGTGGSVSFSGTATASSSVVVGQP